MSEPVFLKVPLGDMSEVELMRALDFIVTHFQTSAYPTPLTFHETKRAVNWLHAKYGERAMTTPALASWGKR
jgi:hypothetical protein